MTNKFTYFPLPGGTWRTEGELTPGTKWCRIEISGRGAGSTIHKVNAAKEMIEGAIKSGHAPAEWYALVAEKSPHAPMSEEVKAKLKNKNQENLNEN